jgi:hypothetical protein
MPKSRTPVRYTAYGLKKALKEFNDSFSNEYKFLQDAIERETDNQKAPDEDTIKRCFQRHTDDRGYVSYGTFTKIQKGLHGWEYDPSDNQQDWELVPKETNFNKAELRRSNKTPDQSKVDVRRSKASKRQDNDRDAENSQSDGDKDKPPIPSNVPKNACSTHHDTGSTHRPRCRHSPHVF